MLVQNAQIDHYLNYSDDMSAINFPGYFPKRSPHFIILMLKFTFLNDFTCLNNQITVLFNCPPTGPKSVNYLVRVVNMAVSLAPQDCCFPL